MRFAAVSVLLVFLTFSSPGSAEPLKVGMILPLSGYTEAYGASVRNAITLLESELGKEQANRIQFIYEDSKYEGKTALSAFHKLTKINKIDLLYVWGTTPSVVLAPLAESSKIPMIALSGDSQVAGGRTYVIDSCNRLEDFSRNTLNHIRSKGYKKIGIVKTEIQFLESLYQGIKDNLRDDETVHLIDSFTPDTSADIKTSVSKIKSGISKGAYDIIGVLLISGQISLFYQRLEQLQISIPTFGSDFFGDSAEMKKSGQLATGAFFTLPYVAEDFQDKYVARFNNSQNIVYAYNTYTLFKILYDLFPEDSENLSADEIISRIEQHAPRSSNENTVYFTEDDPTQYKNPGKRFVSDLVINTIKEDGTH